MEVKKQKLVEWPIPMESIKSRVDLARIEVYRSFLREKSPEDIYVESFLNCFIALVQYPISFVFFDDSLKPIFHFCSDKEHRHWFEEMIQAVKWNEKNTFELFSQEKNRKKYHISIVLMRSKLKSQNDKDRALVIRKDYDFDSIDSFEKYISACALIFFENPWIGFSTIFSDQFNEALILSIESISRNHVWGGGQGVKKWPVDEDEIISYSQKVKIPNKELGTWKKVLSDIFSKVFYSSDYGYEAVSRISHAKENYKSLRKKRQPTNMLIAYRSFSRESGDLRHENDNGGYSYDTHFLIPKDMETDSSYSEFFTALRLDYTGRKKYNRYDSQGRCFYKDLYNLQDLVEAGVPSQKSKILKRAAEVIDEHFWDRLSAEGGHRAIVENLGETAGKYVRSLVDPVYYTGLVHINPVFEFWGLDRVDQSFFEEEVDSFEDFSEDIKDDLLRIVSLYYLLSGAASWECIPGSENKPQRLSAFLMPVKMRGSVWGVTIHAFYTPEFSTKFGSNSSWISGFLLSTALREKNQTLFDRILWENSIRRVSSLLSKNIGASSPSSFMEAVDTVNEKLKGEQLLTPYAFPQFKVTEGGRISNDSYYDVVNQKGEVLRFSWRVDENICFSARQPWSGEGTRDFHKAVEVGVEGGLKMMFTLNKNKSSGFMGNKANNSVTTDNFFYEWFKSPNKKYIEEGAGYDIDLLVGIDEKRIINILEVYLNDNPSHDLDLKEKLNQLEKTLSSGELSVDQIDEAVVSSITKINKIIIDNSRLDPLGKPFHPLESELLDIVEGLKRTLSINGEKVQIVYYKERSDRRMKALEFFVSHYGDYIDAKVIYKDYLRKIDPSLMKALDDTADKKVVDKLLPPNSVRNDRLNMRLQSDQGVRVSQLYGLQSRRKSK